MAHRGPDGYGEFVDDQIFLVHYRLAILDLSLAGTQPFKVDHDRQSVGVYNGELYNYREIASKRAIEQNTSCDTEVVFKGIDQHGIRILPEYNGIFALAQYFPDDGTLFLARDRLGVKPLYVVDTPDYFAFASEAKVLYAFQEQLEIDPCVLSEFLTFGSSMSLDTMVHGVKKVPPGHFVKFELETGTSSTEAYWRVPEGRGDFKKSHRYEETKKTTSGLLVEAVERQCQSDVPIGAYLSGGLDSSMVVALAAQRSQRPISTFSVQFEGSQNSELPLARQVAERFGTDHHEMEISTKDLEADLHGLTAQYDEPFADPAALPLHLMAAKCASMTKVILQGDGGDELFAGYGRHLDLSQYRRRKAIFAVLSRIHPNVDSRLRFAKRHQALAKTPLAAHLAAMAGAAGNDRISEVLRGPMKAAVLFASPLRLFELCATKFGGQDPVRRMLSTDMMTILPHTFLEKVDKVSMWHSVEARVPMLDNALVDYVSTLPTRYKIRKGITKTLLRDIAADMLPEEVLSGRKQSFGTPMDIWLRTFLFDYAQDLFHRSRERWSHWFDFDRIDALHVSHARGEGNHSSILWRLVVLLSWLEHYKDKVWLGESSTSSEAEKAV